MKKKGQVDMFVIISLCIFFIFLVIYLFISVKALEESKDKACQDLGYKEYIYSESFKFCEDINGNLHYVKWKRNDESWFSFDFSGIMKEISVGDVRVLK